MTVAEEPGLAGLNEMTRSEAERVLTRCCSSPRWAESVAAGRPYPSRQAMYAAAESALADLDDVDVEQALAGHPRIGERAPGAEGAWSRQEQRGVDSASEATLTAIAEGNRAYEERFGHVYLVCASGKHADELLALLRTRLQNDPATERRAVRHELAKINRIRLGRLMDQEEAT
ncbi:MAG: 2-oxo-4-hydroxy-4-carboxy-5-ureidoimidazoline decarboxylase [Nocardioidaceae bacterium]